MLWKEWMLIFVCEMRRKKKRREIQSGKSLYGYSGGLRLKLKLEWFRNESFANMMWWCHYKFDFSIVKWICHSFSIWTNKFRNCEWWIRAFSNFLISFRKKRRGWHRIYWHSVVFVLFRFFFVFVFIRKGNMSKLHIKLQNDFRKFRKTEKKTFK